MLAAMYTGYATYVLPLENPVRVDLDSLLPQENDERSDRNAYFTLRVQRFSPENLRSLHVLSGYYTEVHRRTQNTEQRI